MRRTFLDEQEIDRLGAWIIGGIACLCLKQLLMILWNAVEILPTWHSMSLSQALRVYLYGFAYLAYWLSPAILGTVVGITGWLVTRDNAMHPLFYSWRGLFLLSLSTFFIDCIYDTIFLYYTNQYPIAAWEWVWTPMRWARVLLSLLIQMVFLRFVPVVANGLDLLFERIRERWLL